MANRSVEVKLVGGFRELLNSTILDTQESRDVVPSAEALARIKAAGLHFIEQAGTLTSETAVLYTAVTWPEQGPVKYGLIWATNPRHNVDPITGQPGFFREFTETEEQSGDIKLWNEVDEELARYAVAQFGRPKVVE